jgi:hypothetical protein
MKNLAVRIYFFFTNLEKYRAEGKVGTVDLTGDSVFSVLFQSLLGGVVPVV